MALDLVTPDRGDVYRMSCMNVSSMFLVALVSGRKITCPEMDVFIVAKVIARPSPLLEG